jgi:hypothetical protein
MYNNSMTEVNQLLTHAPIAKFALVRKRRHENRWLAAARTRSRNTSTSVSESADCIAYSLTEVFFITPDWMLGGVRVWAQPKSRVPL